jgi:hypothetical protein
MVASVEPSGKSRITSGPALAPDPASPIGVTRELGPPHTGADPPMALDGAHAQMRTTAVNARARIASRTA